MASFLLTMVLAFASAMQLSEALEAPIEAVPALRETDVSAWLDGFVPYALAQGNVAGAVVVVVHDGRVLVQRGYGYADIEKRTPVDPESTLFRAGSVSKLFTWTAVMQLVEQGKLDLDADVNTYLDFEVPANGQPITLRHVLTHTTGLAERFKDLMTAEPEGLVSLEEYLKAWVPRQIYAPGTTPAYSNYAAGLAGYIVERVSGLPFEEYVERHIFQPLDMQHSSFRQPLPEPLKPLISQGYALASGDPKPYEMIPAAPAGGVAASGADIAKFMIAHLQGAAGRPSPILSAQTATAMYTAQQSFTPPLCTMALGFYESNINGHRVIGHGGDTQWFHSALHLFTERGVGLYLSMNSAGNPGVSMTIRNEIFRRFADRYVPPSRETAVGSIDAETARAHARLLASKTYRNTRRPASGFVKLMNLQQLGFTVNDDDTISVAGLDGTNGQPIRWREVSPFVWQDVHGKERLAAVVKDGEVSHWTIESFAPIMQFEPAPASLLPLLGISLLVLVLSVVNWPVAAIVRRRYRVQLDWPGRDLQAYRLSRIASTAIVAVWVGWIVLTAWAVSDLSHLSSSLDGWIVLLSAAGWLTSLVGIAAIAWNTWRVWVGRRGWWSKLWNTLLLPAAIVAFCIALQHGLLSFATEY